jgi:hypothetical protein
MEHLTAFAIVWLIGVVSHSICQIAWQRSRVPQGVL